MKYHLHLLSLLFLSALLAGCSEGNDVTQKTMHQVDFSQVTINDAFWSPRLENNALHTIPVCIDQIENKTGRIQNFVHAGTGEGGHSGIFFDDSDVYKALEGIAYSLVVHPDAALEAKADEWIAAIASAQQPDGYINTFYTLTGPDKRWTDTDKHEMYCAGHLIEAGIAYWRATGKRTLLDVGQRMADYMMTVFGPGLRDWVPGHEEIELALCKLYDVTSDKRYLDFAHWLLEERGHGHGMRADGYAWVPKYYQDEVPVRDLRTINGHAVRAMYLFCGMSDVAALCPDTGYLEALDSLWKDVTERQMYVTGGIGVAYRSEGFSEPYDLPNFDAYCETCASIGMVLWSHRMNEWKGDARYVDVLERSLFNGVLAGISTNGERFFYVNPLASHGGHHRQEWYGCACCPSNVCRFIPSIGNYIYGTSDDALWVNLYIGSSTECRVGRHTVGVTLYSSLPAEGVVTLTFDTPFKDALRLRVPEWCEGEFSLTTADGNAVEYTLDRGYAVVDGKWKRGDKLCLTLSTPVRLQQADPRVKEDVGKRAVSRGPIIYCAEGIDNSLSLDSLVVSADTQWTASNDTAIGGIVRLSAQTPDGNPIELIPYYSWDNREPCEMRVWLPLLEQ